VRRIDPVEKYTYCPYCGCKLIIKQIDEEGAREYCLKCKEPVFHNSKVCVGGLITKGEKVLLAKRTKNPSQGSWNVPGGFLEAGEHPIDGLKREMREETGYDVEPVELLGLFIDVYRYREQDIDTLNIHYLVRIVGGEEKAGSDAGDLCWFVKDNLPQSLAFRNDRDALKAWYQRIKNK
jgi:8-oxo-dGTP diphosphatase